MGINLLGHFALAKALLPSLEETARQYYHPSDATACRLVVLDAP